MEWFSGRWLPYLVRFIQEKNQQSLLFIEICYTFCNRYSFED